MTTLYQNAHSSERGPVSAFQYLDVIVVVIAAIPALILGVPTLGYVVGGGFWIGQRVLQNLDRRWTNRLSEPRQQLAAHLFEAFGRIWILAIAIIIAGVAGGRADGLTAAIVIFGAYSIAFTIRVFSGPPDGKGTKTR